MYTKKFIHLGEIHIGVKPTQIITVLGSCIAVCLFDRVELVGGMNHYELPLWNGNGLQSPKYGNIAIERLIDGMLNIGCRKENLEAKLFGGASQFQISSEALMVGRKNILVARELLKEYHIPIIAADTGGLKGRHIMLMSDTGKVLMSYLNKEGADGA
jgi:chemotaxis protein CheD